MIAEMVTPQTEAQTNGTPADRLALAAGRLQTTRAEDLVRPRELADRYGIVSRTVRKAMQENRLPHRKIGGFAYTTEEVFLAWLDTGESRPGPVPKIRNPKDPEAASRLPSFLRRED